MKSPPPTRLIAFVGALSSYSMASYSMASYSMASYSMASYPTDGQLFDGQPCDSPLRDTGSLARNPDRLALVDKAIPHALFDLMLSEASSQCKPTPVDVLPSTGQLLWRTGLELVRFVSEPGHQRAFGLSGGQLHLALNCDPNTVDRESVQAAKQFHLHLLYWTAEELAALSRSARPPSRLADETSAFRLRQCMDPLGLLGAHVIHRALSDLRFGIADARLLDCDDAAAADGRLPLGCVIRLPGWQVLESPAFEDMIRRLHRRLTQTGEQLLDAFTGHTEPPPPWQRHPLRPIAEIDARLSAFGWPAPLRAGLLTLAAGLRDLSALQAAHLRRASARARKHCMTLNLPCYALNLHAPLINRLDTPLIEADGVYLILQSKLFSGIGGAGLLSLGGIPSVRVLRGRGRYSEADWRRRAAFQRAFAVHNDAALRPVLGPDRAPVRRFANCQQGWV
jgi:hypothetical protein